MDADEEAEDARCARGIEIAPGRLCPDARGRPNDGRCTFDGAGHGGPLRAFGPSRRNVPFVGLVRL